MICFSFDSKNDITKNRKCTVSMQYSRAQSCMASIPFDCSLESDGKTLKVDSPYFKADLVIDNGIFIGIGESLVPGVPCRGRVYSNNVIL